MGGLRQGAAAGAGVVRLHRRYGRWRDLAAFLLAGLVGVGVFWLFQRTHDGRRETDFCLAAVRLVLNERYGDHRILDSRLEDRAITRERAIRLIFPNYDPDLPRVMRYRPPPTDDMLGVMLVARRFALRRVVVRFRVPVSQETASGGAVAWSPVHRTSCEFLRIDGETQWLRFVDRSAFLTAARISLDHGVLPDTCCLYRYPEVR